MSTATLSSKHVKLNLLLQILKSQHMFVPLVPPMFVWLQQSVGRSLGKWWCGRWNVNHFSRTVWRVFIYPAWPSSLAKLVSKYNRKNPLLSSNESSLGIIYLYVINLVEFQFHAGFYCANKFAVFEIKTQFIAAVFLQNLKSGPRLFDSYMEE